MLTGSSERFLGSYVGCDFLYDDFSSQVKRLYKNSALNLANETQIKFYNKH